MFGKKVGLFCSSFDILHAGHISAIQKAKSQCDELIVALNVHPEHKEGKHKPIQSVYERWLQLDAIKYIDKIIPYEDDNDLILLMQTVDYDIRFLGADYRGKEFVGMDYDNMKNHKIIFLDRDHSLSTSELRKRVFKAEGIDVN